MHISHAGIKEFFRNRWVLFLLLVIFIAFKLPHLPVAYYWDESWPYAAAVKAMYHNGVGIMPAALDGNLSRGHPLFFHALAASWMNVFGPSHVSMHSFALFISVLFLVSIYEIALNLFSRRAAIISIVLIASQMIFFVQSSFLLLEILLAFLGFLSLYFYAKGRYVLTALCLSMAFYTKESGLLFGLVPGLDALVSLFNARISVRTRLFRILSVAVPCILIAVFFILQKQLRGWYILPAFTDYVPHSWDTFWSVFRNCILSAAFIMDVRYYDFLALLALSIVAAIKNKKAGYLILFFPGTIIYYFADDARANKIMPSIPFFIVLVISIAAMLFVLTRLRFFGDKQQRKFVFLLCIFIFCFFCFSSLNAFTPRYLLPALIPLLFFAAVLFDMMLARTYKWLLFPVLLVILSASAYNFATNTNYGDCETGAFRGLEVQQHVVNYFEQHNYYDKNISAISLESGHLSDPATGFLHTGRAFRHVRWDIDNNSDFVVFDDIEPDNRYGSVKNDTNFVLVDRYEKGNVWAEIYAHKRR